MIAQFFVYVYIKKTMKVNVVSHTHWDREWYRSYQEFRVIFVETMDGLLSIMDSDPEFRFMLDGQTSLVEDYLDVRPCMAEKIKQYVSSGRLVIGPWYTQPDEYLISGESMVRNLLIGKMISEKFGSKPMKVGYLPDSFGQAEQIPQILNGFNIEFAVFWRGISDDITKDVEFWWEAPEGSKVLTIRILQSYGNGFILSKKPRNLKQLINNAVIGLAGRSKAQQVLLLNGWDHGRAYSSLTDTLVELNGFYKGKYEFVQTSLEDVMQSIKEKNPELITLKGEFREPKDMRIHPGISSTRMDIKSANKKIQHKLESYVEPLSSMMYLFGGKYSNDTINRSWKYILENHAHDSMCSCCADEPLMRVVGRYRDAHDIADTVYKQCFDYFMRNVADQEDGLRTAYVFNTLPYKRNECAEIRVLSATPEIELSDENGKVIPIQILECKKVKEDINKNPGQELNAIWEMRPDDMEVYYDSEGNYVPVQFNKEPGDAYRIKVAADIGGIDGFSWKKLFVRENVSHFAESEVVKVTADSLENAYFNISINPDGSLNILDKQSGKTFKNANAFEDGGDAGDEFNYSPPVTDRIFSSLTCTAKAKIVEAGPVRGAIRISLRMETSEDLSENLQTRLDKKAFIEIVTVVSIDNKTRRIDFETAIDNHLRNHRICVLFPTNVHADYSTAEEQFGFIDRPNRRPGIDSWKENGWTEAPLALYQMQNYVCAEDGQSGIALLNKDITEYEICERKGVQQIALTLLRSVGLMGRENLVVRPGRQSGLKIETPDAQCIGRHFYSYAFIPYSGDFVQAKVPLAAVKYNAPLVSFIPEGSEKAAGSANAPSLEINNENLIFTALKKSEKENALIFRFYNSAREAVDDATLHICFPVTKIVQTKLDEESDTREIPEIHTGLYPVPIIKSKQICTIKIYLGGKVL